MRWCITGSRRGRPDVDFYLDACLAKHGPPTQFICGGLRKNDTQRGVDEQAYQWALRRLDHATIVREYLRDDLPWPRCGGERDQRMADHVGPGDLCIALPGKKSKGTWLTASMCFDNGATIAVCKLRGAQ